MEGQERRILLLDILEKSGKPISGSQLAKKLSVSRQVIVQDVALLRAMNKNIISTTKGYLLYFPEQQKANRCFLIKHTTEEIEDELAMIVDLGGKILNVTVTHPIYGEISTDLMISSKQDVTIFVKQIKDNDTVPLKNLSQGVHFHTIEANSEEVLDNIEEGLRKKGYLIENI